MVSRAHSVARSCGLFVCAFSAALGCEQSPPPGAEGAARTSGAPQAGDPTLPDELKPKAPPAASAGADRAQAAAPHPGPWFVVTSVAAAVYSEPRFDRERKIGYVRNGGKLPVRADAKASADCTKGWFEIVGGGFVCGNVGTTDLGHPGVKFALKAPNLDEVLPYVYARNAKNGTPLYRSVPSREQMLEYEPYLDTAKRNIDSDPQAAAEAAALQPASVTGDAGALVAGPALADGGLVPLAEPAPDKPWWQRDDIKDRLHEVKLEELTADADGILAKRMVVGFYVAVDKTFTWNGRTWYKTTKGLIAPSERFWQTAGYKFQGVELDGTNFKLPVGWVHGWRKSAPVYEIDAAGATLKTAGSIERMQAVQLTGRTQKLRGKDYHETKDGTWIRDIHVRVTSPGAPPADLLPTERWIEVNLSQQTLIAFEGTRPVYATLVSTGKESKIKEKDHRTPTGEWRIREKHVATTMDGDGTAAGDLPYSIEDVPYVMYFHNSYAAHGAFWHRNFGVRMSHGCVNLAPLDAKRLFFFVDPPLPEGWHGAWSTPAQPGSRIVVR
jgi:hypothetical protein